MGQTKLFAIIWGIISMVIGGYLQSIGWGVLAWVFFRAENIGHAFNYLSTIFSKSLFTIPHFTGMRHGLTTLILIFGFIIIEWFGRSEQYAIARLGITWKRPIRYAMYYSIILAIFWFMGEQQQFIYFQF